MADLKGLENAFLEFYNRKDWGNARRFLLPLLSDSDAETAGWARIMNAMALFAESVRNIWACLDLTDQAIALLQDFPEQKARAVIRGMRYAQAAPSADRFERYAGMARKLAECDDPTVRRWRARLLIWVAYYYRHTGNLTKTVHYLERATAAAKTDTISTANNRRCDLQIARDALADVLLEHGQKEKAVEAVAKSLRPGSEIHSPESLAYVQGHLAMEEGRPEQAERSLLEALRLAGERSDTPFVRRIAITLAEVYQALGETAKLVALLEGLIDEYTDAKMYTAAVQMQRIRNRVMNGEGSKCGGRLSG